MVSDFWENFDTHVREGDWASSELFRFMETLSAEDPEHIGSPHAHELLYREDAMRDTLRDEHGWYLHMAMERPNGMDELVAHGYNRVDAEFAAEIRLDVDLMPELTGLDRDVELARQWLECRTRSAAAWDLLGALMRGGEALSRVTP